MKRHFKIIFRDFLGLWSVCGPGVALHWLWAVMTHLPACRRAGNLQPADAAVGDGPFRLTLGGARASLGGRRVLTGIRELWVRNVYLRGPLSIPPDANVVDLGANCGTFTALALGHGNGVHVVAVEADGAECKKLEAMLSLNRWQSRVKLINAFVGGKTHVQEGMSPVKWITQKEIVEAVGGGRVHLLKCDIEGSEFELFSGENPLLEITDQITMEVHPDLGDAAALLEKLKEAGFELTTDEFPPTIVVRAQRKKGN
ncbi:MAG: FkbM family methyltransferase [Tepidisphaeraceae bacterium]